MCLFFICRSKRRRYAGSKSPKRCSQHRNLTPTLCNSSCELHNHSASIILPRYGNFYSACYGIKVCFRRAIVQPRHSDGLACVNISMHDYSTCIETFRQTPRSGAIIMIPISKPLIGEEEQAAVRRVLESGMLAQGPRVAEFELAFANFIGVRYAIATSNGTTALHAALLAQGVGPGDEVITTPFTFMASVNSILYCGAHPVLVDIDESFNLNPTLIEAAITERTKAIMPVHLYGLPANMADIGKIAQKHQLAVIEDACQAHGAEFDGRKVGTFGTGCFSFYATKNMTTGEGGIITTNDDQVAQHARQLISHGMKTRYYHQILGYNYRMTDIAAAVGIEQLKKLPAFNTRRIETAQFYNTHLTDIPGVITPRIFPRRTHVFHQYTLRFTPNAACTRDEIAQALGAQGIGTGIYYPLPVHKQESLQLLESGQLELPFADQMSSEVLSLPVHPGVTDADRLHIVQSIAAIASS
ncbi:MAG: DegT/DnrJ/EryC1/StrS family aminotransferase [Roseiflexaceae bacterium]